MPASSSSPLIKGYLPVRLKLPSSIVSDDEEETFFFVREHQGKSDSESSSNAPGCTLFVANVPVVPGIATKILLQSIFGRYADITRVTAIDNPRASNNNKHNNNDEESLVASSWSSKALHPSFLSPIHSEGKYAHVVFQSPKDMKKTLRALQDIMRQNTTSSDDLPGLALEKIEIQTLSDETNRLFRENRRKKLSGKKDADSEEDESDDEPAKTKSGIHAVAERYRASCHQMTRSQLLEECNAVMQAYEDAEGKKKRAQETAKTLPDDDGFVTVNYSTAVGSKSELEDSMMSTAPNRRKGGKRNRKKKQAMGAEELKDFYRFQRREGRKRSLEDLRHQFDEDLRKVKRMKDERQYRPF
jgi:ribosomal RNA-processing protein 7